MAMTMNGEVTAAGRPGDRLGEAQRCRDVLKACIPGCQSLEKTSDTEFQAVAKVKVGPVKATFKGKVDLTDIEPAERLHDHRRGRGRRRRLRQGRRQGPAGGRCERRHHARL